MKIAVFAYSPRGCETAKCVKFCFSDPDITLYAPERLDAPGFLPIGEPDFYGEQFRTMDALIFVGACGIAVRHVAPYIQDRKTDPAVLVVDELGKFVIPLLSGRISGANDLALSLANALGAMPVVTASKDVTGTFSVDAWAAKNRCSINNMQLAKNVSDMIENKDIPVFSEFPVVSPYPGGLFRSGEGKLGIYISCSTSAPFGKTLQLIPKILQIGIDCPAGTPASDISDAVDRLLEANSLDERAICGVGVIDSLRNEPGILKFCEERHYPAAFCSSAELAAVEGDFSGPESDTLNNISERAAMVGAEKLVVHETTVNGITVAIAQKYMEVKFA